MDVRCERKIRAASEAAFLNNAPVIARDVAPRVSGKGFIYNGGGEEEEEIEQSSLFCNKEKKELIRCNIFASIYICTSTRALYHKSIIILNKYYIVLHFSRDVEEFPRSFPTENDAINIFI